MKCNLKVITPVHIGCDTEYPAFFYSIEGNKIKIYDVFKTISENIPFDKIKEMEVIFSEHSNKNKVELYAYELFKELEIPEKDWFLLDEIENCGLQKNKRHIQIDEFIHFVKDRKIFRYVPGSSIKGAIRTSLLWWGWKKRNDLFNNIQKIKTDSKYDVTVPIFGNIKQNVMKCISVSDSDPIESKKFAVYIMNRKNSIPKACVCLKENTEVNFEIRVNKNYKEEYKKLLELLDLKDDPSEKEVINRILEICNEFYKNNFGANLNIGFGGGYDYKTLKKLLENCWKGKTLSKIEEEYVVKKYMKGKEKKIYKIQFACPKKHLKNLIKYENFPMTEWKINSMKPGFVKLEVLNQ
jgi:CRISPR type III-A-associated RAMP protein Csm5